ncbi:MAG: phage head-tail joining protein [Alphaproteobacteria bacterium]
MAWTQSDLDALDRALKSGARRVTYGSGNGRKEVEYHTVDEMMRLRASMQAEIAAATGADPPPRYSFAGFRRG